MHTHVDEVPGVSEFNVVENRGFVQVGQRRHVFHTLDTGLVHRRDNIVGAHGLRILHILPAKGKKEEASKQPNNHTKTRLNHRCFIPGYHTYVVEKLWKRQWVRTIPGNLMAKATIPGTQRYAVESCL